MLSLSDSCGSYSKGDFDVFLPANPGRGVREVDVGEGPLELGDGE